MSNIRSAAIGLTVLVISLAFYYTPHLAIYNMKQAVDSRNAQAFSKYVDFPALRESVKENLNAQMARQKAKNQEANQFEALGDAFTSALVDPLVDLLVTPEGLAILWKGESSKMLSQPLSLEPGHKSEVRAVKGADAATSMSYRGLNRFVVSIQDRNSDQPIELIFQRTRVISWKLSAIEWDTGAPLK
jgi:hypothetical protein